ncbi:hypothetical protein O3P69_019940 [Scylla paramamosain]|uniref:Uncharacterized protein n=1 Tax=Scylla paramamosain TaxID=85552 RepID=A0AAW0SHX3_SCYPA
MIQVRLRLCRGHGSAAACHGGKHSQFLFDRVSEFRVSTSCKNCTSHHTVQREACCLDDLAGRAGQER